MKKLVSTVLAVCLLLPFVPLLLFDSKAASFDDINQSSVFLKQNTNYTCTLCSATMMLRRAAMMTGNTNWANITESSMRPVAWCEGAGLYFNFSYAGMSVSFAYASGKDALISLLKKHPEGIVAYSESACHAVLLTDYTNGVFYCADPANYYPSGRIELGRAYKVGLNNINSYWYVSSPSCSLDDVSAPTLTSVSSYGNSVTVNWNQVDHATSYDVYLIQSPWSWEAIKYSQSCSSSASSCTFSNVDFGYYGAFVISRPNDNTKQSNCINFNVSPIPVPTAPTISCDRSYALAGSTVTISWNSVSGATGYSYYLTEYPEGFAYTTNTKNGTTENTYINLDNMQAGKYSFFLHAYNSSGSSNQSNWISFTVAEEEYVPTETKIYNGHIYSVYDYEMSWSFAEEVCEYMGGHLVTVADQSEQNFLATLISSGKKEAYWIGADNFESNAESQDGQWKWVTGEPFSYTAWKKGEPSASGTRGEREHFAEIRKTYSNLWNDVNNINKTNKGFVIEIEPQDEDITETIHYNGNTYKLIDRDTTWSGAKAYCELLGGHLATIETSDEYKKICDFLSSGKKVWYYLGGKKTDSQGNGKWIDGSSITKTDGVLKWSGYEAGNCLFAYKKSGTVGWMGDSYVNLPEIHCLGFVCEIESKITLDAVKVSNSAVSFDLQSKLDGSATAVIAYYTSTGQLLQCDTQEITLESGTKTIDTTPPTGYATLKIFLLGEGNLPLCEAYTQNVK